MVTFDPALAVPSFPELQFKMLIQSFTPVEDLIVDVDFYSMTMLLLSLFHNMFELRNIQNFDIPMQIPSIFQPVRKYQSVREKLSLLTMFGANVSELSSLARTHAKESALQKISRIGPGW